MSFEAALAVSCVFTCVALIIIFGGSILIAQRMDQSQGAQNAEINKSITFYRSRRGW